MRTIRIFDTTLRDGEQAPGCTMNPREKVDLARQLERLGVDIIASRREHDLITTDPRDIERMKERQELEKLQQEQAGWAAATADGWEDTEYDEYKE